MAWEECMAQVVWEDFDGLNMMGSTKEAAQKLCLKGLEGAWANRKLDDCWAEWSGLDRLVSSMPRGAWATVLPASQKVG